MENRPRDVAYRQRPVFHPLRNNGDKTLVELIFPSLNPQFDLSVQLMDVVEIRPEKGNDFRKRMRVGVHEG